MVHDARFVSVWDDSVALSSNCKYDDETNLAYDIETMIVDNLDDLKQEYIELPNGIIVEDFEYE